MAELTLKKSEKSIHSEDAEDLMEGVFDYLK